jgi:hypothetical protein
LTGLCRNSAKDTSDSKNARDRLAAQMEAGFRKAGLPAGASADSGRVVEQAVVFFLAREAGEFWEQGMPRRQTGFLAVEDGRDLALASLLSENWLVR